ncbi:MAG: metallopeptidase family protein [Syntrophomonadaceae bacterium]|nr:metallopeptidase family protein [Syntrophomonadaceae bacterium]MDH7498220.1 metallopeptidase family protein [Syntrophomonadaceae bacterium]
MKMTLDEFSELTGRLVDEVPPRLCRELNGGFSVLPEVKRDGELLVLGQYIENGWLGSMIVFYYGSFAALLGDQPLEAWEKELRDTIWHELRHHLESRAGLDDLAREEAVQLAEYFRQRGVRERR